MISLNDNKYQEILKVSKKFNKNKPEKNIFSLGARGHYENPISDIMAFFLDPREEHQFNDLFLKCLFNCVGRDGLLHPDFGTVIVVEREVMTNKGNRIDLLVEGEDWVLIIENKVFHILNNPLKDYEDYIFEKYPDKSNRYFFVLSLGSSQGTNWYEATYRELLEELQRELGNYFLNPLNNKWFIILREYLLNIKELLGDANMDKEQLEFIQTNYADILKLINLKDNYIQYLIKEINKVLAVSSGRTVKNKIANWNNGRIAMRFFGLENWNEKSNVVLVLSPNGDFEIRYYIYDIPDEENQKVNNHFLINGYEFWKEQKTISCYKSKVNYDFDSAKAELIKIVELVDMFYK